MPVPVTNRSEQTIAASFVTNKWEVGGKVGNIAPQTATDNINSHRSHMTKHRVGKVKAPPGNEETRVAS